MELDAMILVFWMLSFKLNFSPPLSLSSRGSLVPLHFLPQRWYHLRIWGYWYFSWQSWFELVLHPAQDFTWCTLHLSWIHSLDILLSQFGTSLLFQTTEQPEPKGPWKGYRNSWGQQWRSAAEASGNSTRGTEVSGDSIKEVDASGTAIRRWQQK